MYCKLCNKLYTVTCDVEIEGRPEVLVECHYHRSSSSIADREKSETKKKWKKNEALCVGEHRTVEKVGQAS